MDSQLVHRVNAERLGEGTRGLGAEVALSSQCSGERGQWDEGALLFPLSIELRGADAAVQDEHGLGQGGTLTLLGDTHASAPTWVL